MAYGQYIPAWSGEEISDILHLPDTMWQESWGKVELLLVMRIDEPKFLVCYREAALVYESFKQLYTCSAFFYAHKFIHIPFSSLHVFSNNLYKGFGSKWMNGRWEHSLLLRICWCPPKGICHAGNPTNSTPFVFINFLRCARNGSFVGTCSITSCK